jgi:hypothetical protein
MAPCFHLASIQKYSLCTEFLPARLLRHVGHFFAAFMEAFKHPSQNTWPHTVELSGLTPGGSKQMAHLITKDPGGCGSGGGGVGSRFGFGLGNCTYSDLGGESTWDGPS